MSGSVIVIIDQSAGYSLSFHLWNITKAQNGFQKSVHNSKVFNLLSRQTKKEAALPHNLDAEIGVFKRLLKQLSDDLNNDRVYKLIDQSFRH